MAYGVHTPWLVRVVVGVRRHRPERAQVHLGNVGAQAPALADRLQLAQNLHTVGRAAVFRDDGLDDDDYGL